MTIFSVTDNIIAFTTLLAKGELEHWKFKNPPKLFLMV